MTVFQFCAPLKKTEGVATVRVGVAKWFALHVHVDVQSTLLDSIALYESPDDGLCSVNKY
jgi:hypothetical protein